MLSADYFDGTRLLQFSRLQKEYSNGVPNVPSLDINYNKYIRGCLLLDVRIYDFICSYDENLLVYLLPWCKSIKYVEKNNNIRIKFPVVESHDMPYTKVFDLRDDIMGMFFFFKMYTLYPDIQNYEIVKSCGGCSFNYELPGERETQDDGQLKITTDAVLAVDSLVSRDSVKILVIGSSSDGVTSGIAYDVICTMLTNSEIHLYDPFTVNCSYEIGSNRMRHFSLCYDYQSIESYDLVLDDSWNETSYISEDIEKVKVYDARAFSVKKFPFEQVDCNFYYQAFVTPGREQRAVSREICYNYNFHPLGICPGCLELKYLLKRNYNSEFYEAYFDAHKINCVTKVVRKIEPVSYEEDVFFEIEEPPGNVINMFYKLAWDPDMEGRNLPLNRNIIKESFVKVSHEKHLTGMILVNAKCILKIKDGFFFCYGRVYEQYGFKIRSGLNLSTKKVPVYNLMKEKRKKMKEEPLDTTLQARRIFVTGKKGRFKREYYASLKRSELEISKYVSGYYSSDRIYIQGDISNVKQAVNFIISLFRANVCVVNVVVPDGREYASFCRGVG